MVDPFAWILCVVIVPLIPARPGSNRRFYSFILYISIVAYVFLRDVVRYRLRSSTT